MKILYPFELSKAHFKNIFYTLLLIQGDGSGFFLRKKYTLKWREEK